MFLEYLFVIYKDDEIVAADDVKVGVTNHIMLLPPGDYTIALQVSGGTTPASVDVSLDGTSMVRPCVVTFA